MFWPYLQICGSQLKMWVLVEDLSPSQRFESQSKFRVQVEDSHWIRDRTVKDPKLTLNCTHAKKPTEINSAETRRTKCSRNDRCLKNRVTSDKSYNMIFHVHSHGILLYQSRNMHTMQIVHLVYNPHVLLSCPLT